MKLIMNSGRNSKHHLYKPLQPVVVMVDLGGSDEVQFCGQGWNAAVMGRIPR